MKERNETLNLFALVSVLILLSRSSVCQFLTKEK